MGERGLGGLSGFCAAVREGGAVARAGQGRAGCQVQGELLQGTLQDLVGHEVLCKT